MSSKRFQLALVPALLGLCFSIIEPTAASSFHGLDHDRNDSTLPCRRACATLMEKFPKQTFMDVAPEMEDKKQTEIIPACYIQPESADEVAFVYSTVRREHCRFAIKSGGHGRLLNQSNQENGVTIDLAAINHVNVADDRTSADIGPGLRWGQVYSQLEKHNLIVMGGRVLDVGVGGLLMGGGIAFFSGRYGWACDHILSYEVVLPNSTIANITGNSDPDLFWALHGGTNNFGIVTNFKVRAWPQKPLYWQLQPSFGPRVSSLLKLNERFAHETTDQDASVMFAYGHAAELGMMVAVQYLTHIDPWPSSSNNNNSNNKKAFPLPSVFQPYKRSIWKIPFASTILSRASLSSILAVWEEYNVPGFRSIYYTMTTHVSADMEIRMTELVRETIKELQPVTKGCKAPKPWLPKDDFMFEPFIIFQPLPRKTSIESLSSHHPFNASGVDTSSTSPQDTPSFPFHLRSSTFSSSSASPPPLNIILLSWRWSTPPPHLPALFPTQASWDAFQRTVTKNLWLRLENVAKDAGKFHGFVYPNYAGEGQNPYSEEALGTETMERLRRVQRRVDGEAVFAEGGLCAGGFKVVRDEVAEREGKRRQRREVLGTGGDDDDREGESAAVTGKNGKRGKDEL